MIKVHSYCSYKHSPSGFIYGSFVVGEKTDNIDYYLSEENNADIVQVAFEHGIIRRLCGRIPNSHNYIFLVRKLKYNYGNDHSDIGREVQMNFGFEFDEFDEFLSFVCGFNNAEEQEEKALYYQLANCVIPDENVKIYKYKISKNTLDSWITSIKQPLSNDENEQYKKYKNSICIIASSKSTDYTEEIKNYFRFPNVINGQPVEFYRENNTANYYYSKKKNSSNQQEINGNQRTTNKFTSSKKDEESTVLIIAIISIVLLAIIFGVLFSSQKEKKNQNQSTPNMVMTTDNIIVEKQL